MAPPVFPSPVPSASSKIDATADSPKFMRFTKLASAEMFLSELMRDTNESLNCVLFARGRASNATMRIVSVRLGKRRTGCDNPCNTSPMMKATQAARVRVSNSATSENAMAGYRRNPLP